MSAGKLPKPGATAIANSNLVRAVTLICLLLGTYIACGFKSSKTLILSPMFKNSSLSTMMFASPDRMTKHDSFS